ARRRPLRKQGRLPRRDLRLQRRHRRRLCTDTGAERDGQLDQGGAASAGTHCARPQGARLASAEGRTVGGCQSRSAAARPPEAAAKHVIQNQEIKERTMSAVAIDHSEQPPLQGLMLWVGGVVLALANFVAVLNMTIANVTVPNMAGALGAGSSQGTWVITSYAVAEAITVPLTGWLSGRFGAVRLFCISVVLFGVFSLLCGMSTSLGMLLGMRVLQGMAGGPLLALSQTLLLRIFPKEQSMQAMGLWAMTTLLAPVVGPVLGGWLCDN